MKPSMRGTQRETNPLRLNVAKVHVPLSAVLAAWAARRLGQGLVGLVRLVVRHPWILAPTASAWFLVRLVHGHGLLATSTLAVAATLVLVVWWWRWRDSFTRNVVWRLRGAWRGLMVYRFGWQPAMVTTRLAVTMDRGEYLPKLLRVSSTGPVDRLVVRMLPGQVLEDWTAVGPRLAQTFGAQECRVRTTRHRHRLELWFLVHDPLTEPSHPHPPTASTSPREPTSRRSTCSPAGRTPRRPSASMPAARVQGRGRI
ncbi:MAG TPA: hypothetical protein VFX33_14920 [Actinomycetales bacterium]|nr:hypothetical protein [Actinomycetales bacterium]